METMEIKMMIGKVETLKDIVHPGIYYVKDMDVIYLERVSIIPKFKKNPHIALHNFLNSNE